MEFNVDAQGGFIPLGTFIPPLFPLNKARNKPLDRQDVDEQGGVSVPLMLHENQGAL